VRTYTVQYSIDDNIIDDIVMFEHTGWSVRQIVVLNDIVIVVYQKD
jgi:hypothetical protein